MNLVLAMSALAAHPLNTPSTLRHPYTSPYEGNNKAASAVLLRWEAAASNDVEVPGAQSARSKGDRELRLK